jgi:hypothetical protein
MIRVKVPALEARDREIFPAFLTVTICNSRS